MRLIDADAEQAKSEHDKQTNKQSDFVDLISRKAAAEAIQHHFNPTGAELPVGLASVLAGVGVVIATMPSAQPEPLSDAYKKAVWTWLLDYQIKAAELEGRYTPYEVLSWVANDWRKEHE